MTSPGWRDQYKRMLRSHERLIGSAEVSISRATDSEEPRDALLHFFQDAYHLKDWLKNDESLTLAQRKAVESAIDNSKPLRICADLCNGSKHRVLAHRTRTGDLRTGFITQSIKVQKGDGTTEIWTLGRVSSEPAPGSTGSITSQSVTVAAGAGAVTHQWIVSSGDERIDALVLAGEVVDAWTSWLLGHGLMSEDPGHDCS